MKNVRNTILKVLKWNRTYSEEFLVSKSFSNMIKMKKCQQNHSQSSEMCKKSSRTTYRHTDIVLEPYGENKTRRE